MSALERAIWMVKVPFRVAWGVLLVANFLVFAPLFLLVGAFVAYWVTLTFSFIFLPAAWTEAMWAWASGLYAEHMWFKVATIAAFTFLCLPLLFWPSETEEDRKKREEEFRRANEDLIARQNFEQSKARMRASNF